MATLRDEHDRAAVLARLESLTATTPSRWGRLDAPRMVCHLNDALRMAHGELATRSVGRRAFTRFPLKHLVLHVLPLPRNVRTAPELLTSTPTDFDADRRTCRELIERYERVPAAGSGPSHPLLGVLTWPQWGVLQWRHVDHHLRQFGA